MEAECSSANALAASALSATSANALAALSATSANALTASALSASRVSSSHFGLEDLSFAGQSQAVPQLQVVEALASFNVASMTYVESVCRVAMLITAISLELVWLQDIATLPVPLIKIFCMSWQLLGQLFMSTANNVNHNYLNVFTRGYAVI